MNDPQPKIALVVCTKNRVDRLDPFFESLNRLQCDSPWELIIVDNGSTDGTDQRLRDFVETFPGRAKLVTERRAGLGRARNRGWRVSVAPIIAFTDDDCYPTPNFMNDVIAAFAEPMVGFSGGKILLHDLTDAPITIYEHPDEQIYGPKHFIVAGVIQGASMAFRRLTLLDINGFDDNLGAGTPFAFEDVDAELRALAAGWLGKYDPRSVVFHHHGRKPGKEVEKINRTYDAGRGAYYMKCILFMPHRWQCLRHWLRMIQRQPYGRTAREVQSAIHYFFHQWVRRPNVTY